MCFCLTSAASLFTKKKCSLRRHLKISTSDLLRTKTDGICTAAVILLTETLPGEACHSEVISFKQMVLPKTALYHHLETNDKCSKYGFYLEHFLYI